MPSPLCALHLLQITDAPAYSVPTAQHADDDATWGMQQFTLRSSSIYDKAHHGGRDVKCLDSGG